MGLLIAMIEQASGADPAVIEQAVQDWLEDHPEATTTVQDGSITLAKLASDVAAKINQVSQLSDEIIDVKSAITTDVKDVTGNEIIYFSSGWINTSGGTVDINNVKSGDVVYTVVSCVEGDKFTISGTGKSAARLWAFVASDGTRLTVAGASETRTNYVLTAPENSAYLVLNARTTSDKIGCFRGVSFYNQYLEDQTNKNDNIRVINHRGYNSVAPENTMPAFKLSRENKFMYIETDVQFTAPDENYPNGVAVLIHDATIDRTSDGTGNVADFTYEQLLQYDFGSWKSSKYAGTKIPTLDEFLLFCKNTGVHAYLELKAGNSTQIGMIVNSVKKHGMRKNVTYISQDDTYLNIVKTADPSARLGYITSTISSQIIATMTGLKTQENIVFCDLIYSGTSDSGVTDLISADIPLELWTVNSTTQITSTYATGYTTDSAKLWSQLYNSAMN